MIEKLIFFNKEGYQMNMNYDENQQLYSNNIFFDKNSTDTFKTQGIYVFEKIDGTNNTFDVELNKFQLFNTNGFSFLPKFDTTELTITNIESVNLNVNYHTKWVYANNIEKSFYPGMWCYFTGLNSYHNTDFNTTVVNTQVRKILAVETGRVLVYTQTANNIALPIFNIVNAKIVPINIIEIQQDLIGEPVWNESNLTSKLYTGKKLSVLSNTNNDKIYTVDKICNEYTRDYLTLAPNLFIPNAGDKLQINIELRTSNILVSNGQTTFDGTTYITLPYIPSFLKVGDSIIAQPKNVPLSLTNTATFQILSIDKSTNNIGVNAFTAIETNDCYIYLATNVFTIEQDIVLDNNNLYSLPLTYFTIVNKYANELKDVAGGQTLSYNTVTDSLEIKSDYTDSYFTITVNKLDINNTVTNYPVTNSQHKIYAINTTEELVEHDELDKNATNYNRNIVFNTIDSLGLKININGKDYYTPFNTDVSTTIGDFITGYNTQLGQLGIQITQTTSTILGDTLNINSEFPNIPIYVETKLGDGTIYYIKYAQIIFQNIKTHLLITINDEEFSVPFNLTDSQTVTDWVNTHFEYLKTLGILVINTGSTLYIHLLDAERFLSLQYNIGYLPKSGDLSIYETLYYTNSEGSVISGNEISCVSGLYNFLDYYSIGQKIDITGATHVPQNISYNIIGLTNNKIALSYQGAYWNQTPSTFINIVSDYFIRYPKFGTSELGNKLHFKWSWKNTQLNDFFLYDFSGTQLKPALTNFPAYNGPIPLCGTNGEYELKLNKLPNTDINEIGNPLKQQTVFDIIENELPFTDVADDNLLEPNPLQVFVGYKGSYEGWNKARLYLDVIEDLSFTRTTNINTIDDLWVWNDNYVEIQNVSILNPINFVEFGFRIGQKIHFTYEDTHTDLQKIGTLNNSGKAFTIKTVYPTKIVFEESVESETSVKSVPTNVLPYYDNYGNVILMNRILKITINVLPKNIAYFDVFGESEDEDERFAINLNNRNLNILKMQDFFIFKEVDIKENGVDWILLNRKRKELIEIYPEIFNNLSNYKSVIQAINFFGYNDLIFSEYFQNIDPENKKFGQLFNMELLNIFEKNVSGYSYSNLGYENLRNKGFRKTNLFSLNYKITDEDGNFINAYSLEEVKIKLLGLKKWLTENILPFGTKITDINGKYKMTNDFVIQHDTYMSKNFRVEEYAAPVDFDVAGYLAPVSQGSNLYDINVQFKSLEPVDWFKYVIRTFNLEQWTNASYLPNSYVFHYNRVWTNTLQTNIIDEPGFSSAWIETSIDNISNVQIISDYKYDLSDVSFTCNELIDPYFVVEVYWHSGYALTKKTIKSYSLPITRQPAQNIYPINLSLFDMNFDFDFSTI